jgi:hypothetical protein
MASMRIFYEPVIDKKQKAMQLRIAFYRKQGPELASRWEDSLQRNDEREAQVGHHVVVGQFSTRDRRAERVHLHVGRLVGSHIKVAATKFCP